MDVKTFTAAVVTAALSAMVATDGHAQGTPAAPAQPEPAAYKSVAANFASGVLESKLPFDEPFLLTGTARAGTKRMFVVWTEKKSVDEVGAVNLQCKEEFGGKLGSRPWIPESVGTTSQNFSILAGPVDAQRYVKFQFCSEIQLPEPVRTRIANAARTAFDRSLRQVALAPGTPTLGTARIDIELESLRKILTDHLQLEPAQYAVDAGSLFSEVPQQAVRDRFDSALVRVVLNTSNRDTVNAAYVKGTTTVSGQLASVLTSRLPELLQLLRKSANQAIVARLAAANDALALVVLSRDAADLWAFGRQPTNVPTPFPGVWTSAEAQAYRDNFRRLYDLLDGLDRFVSATLGANDGSAEFKELLTQLGGPLPVGLSTNVRSLQAAITGARDNVESLGNDAERTRVSLALREQALNDLAELIRLSELSVNVVIGDSLQVSATASSPYISADAGLVFLPMLSDAATYVGTNIYVRPVNKSVPLAIKGGLARRLAMTFGITVDSVEDAAGTRFGVIGNKGVIVGAGYRVTQSVRLAAGTLWFRAKDPNPGRASQIARSTFYVGLSFDGDVSGKMADIFK